MYHRTVEDNFGPLTPVHDDKVEACLTIQLVNEVLKPLLPGRRARDSRAAKLEPVLMLGRQYELLPELHSFSHRQVGLSTVIGLVEADEVLDIGCSKRA